MPFSETVWLHKQACGANYKGECRRAVSDFDTVLSMRWLARQGGLMSGFLIKPYQDACLTGCSSGFCFKSTGYADFYGACVVQGTLVCQY